MVGGRKSPRSPPKVRFNRNKKIPPITNRAGRLNRKFTKLSEKIKIGSTMELIREDEGFFGSMYEVKIMSDDSYSNQYEVEYRVNIDPLTLSKRKDVVPKERLRPSPPMVTYPFAFQVGERVDVHRAVQGEAQSGFWEGLVTQVESPEGQPHRYEVRLTDHAEVLWTDAPHLRVHHECVEGVIIASPLVTLHQAEPEPEPEQEQQAAQQE